MSQTVITNDQAVPVSYSIQEKPGKLLGPFIIGAKKQQAYTPGQGVKTFDVISSGGALAGTVGKTKQVVLPKALEEKRAGRRRAGVADPTCTACPGFPATTAVPLGNAYTFGVLAVGTLDGAGSAVTPTVVGQPANVGETKLIGLPPTTVLPGANIPIALGSLSSDAVTDATAAATAALATCTGGTCTAISGVLDGVTLLPGTYCTASLTGFTLSSGSTLTLDAQGNPNAQFVFLNCNGGGIHLDGIVALANCAKADNVFWITNGPITIGAGATVVGTFISTATGVAITTGAGAMITGRLIATVGDITLGAGTAVSLPAPALTITVTNNCTTPQTFSLADLTPTATPTEPFFTSDMLTGGSLAPCTSVTISVPVGSMFTFASPIGMATTKLTLDPSNVAGDRCVTYNTVSGVCTPAAGQSITVTNACPTAMAFTATPGGATSACAPAMSTSCTLAPTTTTAICAPDGTTTITFATLSGSQTFPIGSGVFTFMPTAGGGCVLFPGAAVATTTTSFCPTPTTVLVSGCGFSSTVTVPAAVDGTPGTATVPTAAGCVNTFTIVDPICGCSTIATASTTIIIAPNAAGCCAFCPCAGATLTITNGCATAATGTITVTPITTGVAGPASPITIPASGSLPITGLAPGDIVTVAFPGSTPITFTVPSTGIIPSLVLAPVGGVCTLLPVTTPTGPAARVCCPRIFVQPLIVKKPCPLFVQDKRRPVF